MSKSFYSYEVGDVVITDVGRMMLITGEIEPMVYTAIECTSGSACVVQAETIQSHMAVETDYAAKIRQAYADRLYRPVMLDDIASAEDLFISAFIGERQGTHADLLAALRRDISAKAVLARRASPDNYWTSMVEYVRSLERHLQASTKYNVENDDYRNRKPVVNDDTQPIVRCVFWNGGYCDCDVPDEANEWCSEDESIIRGKKTS